MLLALGAATVLGAANVATTAADHLSRELLVAHDSMRNERIDASDRGQVQLLFADQSSLSVAPGSEVVINEFLYDPQTQTGNLTATVTTGLVRYVGGEIGKKKDVAFYTPSAVVSVRGGIILIRVERDVRLSQGGGGKTEVLFLSGDRLCVTANGQSQCTTKFATAITSESGKTPSAPVPVTVETIEALLSHLQVADEEPTDALARSASQIDQNSNKPR